MHSCVVRLLENLSALEQFFLSCAHEDQRDTEAQALHEEMKNPYFKAYLMFLKYTLEYFNRMNALFQSSKVLVHRLQVESRQLLVNVCQNYMRHNALESVHKIDVKHPHFQVPLEKIYLGPGTASALEKVPYCARPFVWIRPWRCQAKYAPTSFSFSFSFRPELSHLHRQFKDVYDVNEDELAREWRNMCHEIPSEMSDKLKKMEPEEFWCKISTIQDYKENPKFPNLVKVARLVMTLPHSNAAAEGVFAMVTDTKTKKRNRMGSDTLDSICVVRTAMRQKKIACYQYEVTEDHLKKHNKTIYAKQ